jgi:hypothetical protein
MLLHALACSHSAGPALARHLCLVATRPCASGRWAAATPSPHGLSGALQCHAKQGSLCACIVVQEYSCCACLCLVSKSWVPSHCSGGGGRTSQGQSDASPSPVAAGGARVCSQGSRCAVSKCSVGGGRAQCSPACAVLQRAQGGGGGAHRSTVTLAVAQTSLWIEMAVSRPLLGSLLWSMTARG